ncbi:MAG TPA: glutathione transferase GstA [Xanthobacteraceae bacterium]|nr:glutathione transferase GstA [Xanthobacteraceae bacterium]
MKLYYAPGACSLSPHIALREAGLSFELERVDNKTKRTERGQNYLAINPKGVVPALALDDGEILTEGSAIVQLIADMAPAKKLAPPAGTMERYRLQEWLNYIATELHKGFGPLWKPNVLEDYKKTVKETLAKQFAFTDERLAGRGYVMGDTFTIADGYLFTILNWSKFHNIDLSPYQNLSAFMQRIAARSGVQKAMQAEGLIETA